MMMRFVILLSLLSSGCAFSPSHLSANRLAVGFQTPPATQQRRPYTLKSPPARTSTSLAYTNDPVGDLITEINPAALAATFVAIAAIGFSFFQLLPSIGAAAFELTEAEEAATSAVACAYDNAAWEQEITEEGSKGYVNRRRLANEAKLTYQEGKMNREVRDKSLRYSETNLDFLAVLLRSADPSPRQTLVTLGSGTGRSTLAAAALYPSLSKCVGVEFLSELVKISNGYRGKVKGRKASSEFVTGDFTDDAFSGRYLSNADIVFATATFFNKGELEASLDSLKVGAKVVTVDERLRGKRFKFVDEVNDAAGDLQLNTGYVYEVVA